MHTCNLCNTPLVDHSKIVTYRWRELHIAAGYSTGEEFTDEDVMVAAGVLEGYLSQS